MRILPLMIGTGILSVSCAFAGNEYFAATGKNTEGGGVQGASLTGNPRDWPAVHSQFSGAAATDGLQLVSQANANWTFLWTRRAGDRQTYKVVPQFTVLKECQGQLVLEAGFDPAYAHTQAPWPGGFWVSKDASWCVPAIDTLPAAPGTATLNAAGQAIVVPADMQRFYLRLRLTAPTGPGAARIQAGTVTFQAAGEEKGVAGKPATVRNVVQMGADPTGVKDAAAIIQGALNEGGIVFIPAGTYAISRTLLITRSGTEIRGEPGSMIRTLPQTPVSAIDTSDAYGVWKLHNLVVKELTLVNDPSNYKVGDNLQGTHGIGFTGVTDSRIENCTVKNFQHDGILIAHSRNIQITGCTVEGARHGITINGQYESGRCGNWNIQVNHCRTLDTWDTGIVIGFSSFYVTVADSIIERSRCHGIDIFNVANIIISNNVVRNWNSPHFTGMVTGSSVGIFVHPDWGISTAIPTRDVLITGNLVMFDVPVPPGTTPKGIEVTGNSDTVTVNANQIIGGYCGFFLREQCYDQFYRARPDKRVAANNTPRNIIFSNNICRGQEGRYLWLDSATPLPALLTGNLFAPADGGTAMINVPATASQVAFRGNSFRDPAMIGHRLPAGVTGQDNLFLPVLTAETECTRPAP